jgi:hypothetical protein
LPAGVCWAAPTFTRLLQTPPPPPHTHHTHTHAHTHTRTHEHTHTHKHTHTHTLRISTDSWSRCSFFAIVSQSVAATPARQSIVSFVCCAVCRSVGARRSVVERGVAARAGVRGCMRRRCSARAGPAARGHADMPPCHQPQASKELACGLPALLRSPCAVKHAWYSPAALVVNANCPVCCCFASLTRPPVGSVTCACAACRHGVRACVPSVWGQDAGHVCRPADASAIAAARTHTHPARAHMRAAEPSHAAR